VPCPVCDADDYKVLYEPTVRIDDPAKLYGAASGLTGTQRIVRCNKCEVIYENPRFSEADIIRGYSSSNDAGHDSQHAMRRRSFLSALEGLKDKLPKKGAKILDVGTAGGAFLEAATDFGYDAYGLEPSQFLVEQGKRRGLKISQGTITENSYSTGEFDMVCLWDVLEHLANPKRDLSMIHSLLKPGGTLLINYPDIGTIPAKLAGSKFWWLLSVHLTHFDRKSIKEISNRTGFEMFYDGMYWQTLQFGYLEEMAAHLKVPLSATIKKLTPKFIQNIPVPYYASQTTVLARKK
jgi:2-polyprenyl-3-methyl-5-hydroxy-6-metoxy-1,4-benzoquinol methylase